MKRATLTAGQGGTYYVNVSGDARTALKYNLTIATWSPGGQRSPLFPPPKRFEFEEIETGQWYHRDVPTPEEIARAIHFAEVGFKPDDPLDDFELAVSVREDRPRGVPPLEQSLGADGPRYLVVEHDDAFAGSARVRASVDRATLAERGIDPEGLAIYRHPGPGNDGAWEPLETTVAEAGEGRVVLEATGDGLSVFAIGIAPGPSVYELVAANRALYNRHAGEVPGVLRGIVANERVNLAVETDRDGVETVGVVMEGERVGAVRRGGLDDPSLVVRTSAATIHDVRTADDPAAAARAALRSGRISYHGVGPLDAVKYTAVKLLVGVLDFVGQTFGVGPFA